MMNSSYRYALKTEFLAMFSVIFSGCSAEIPEGRFGCNTDQECPHSWFCRVASGESEGRCFSSANAGTLPPVCPEKAPPPNNQTGACCYRDSNANRLTSPVLRIASLKPTAPLSFTEPALVNVIQRQIDEESLNWLLVLSGTSLFTGHGQRQQDGTYVPGKDRYTFRNTNIAFDEGTERWATRVPIRELLTIPVLDPNAVPILELPLRNIDMSATLSEQRSCVGTRIGSEWETSQGLVTGFVTVEDARHVPVPVGATGANLCSVLSGMPFESDPCGIHPQNTWVVKPDAQCDNLGCTQNACTAETCNAWRIQAAFAAQGVDVSFQPPP